MAGRLTLTIQDQGMNYTRRDLLKYLAAGGMVVAGELWIPGQTKIFLPPEKVFEGPKVVTATFQVKFDGPAEGFGGVWHVREATDEDVSIPKIQVGDAIWSRV